MNNILTELNAVLWGLPMIVALMSTHLYMTYKTRFVQRHVIKGIRLSLSKGGGGDGEVGGFASLATALAATLGTGNIVGLATAIALGGPGAVFWCWISGVFGMATNYSEALLALKYRVKHPDGSYSGGPMNALAYGLGMKRLAALYCIFTMLAGLGAGNMVQANSVSVLMDETFGISPLVTGMCLTALTGLVILGGIKSIAKVCGVLVPFMAAVFVVACFTILVVNFRFIPEAVATIFRGAFSFRSAGAGILGNAVRFGIARGLFTNEAGLGSASIAAAAARTENPVRQALISFTGTFWDTVVLCALTGVTMVTGILRMPAATSGLNGASLTKQIFSQIPFAGPALLSVALLTFVFATLIGWSYYGERCAIFLFGQKAVVWYRLVWIAAVLAGSCAAMPFVWNISDTMNILMALPNIISLVLLSKVIERENEKFIIKTY